ncbi:hypothetical protein TNCV_1527861 [Trichonephila clavipes]|nr:hypothetical protein TNCV_1527861 [Trichonephila clavipes]
MDSPNPSLPGQIGLVHVRCVRYGESTIARSKNYESHRHFKEGGYSIKDDEHIGRPSSRNAEYVVLVFECVRKDRRQTLAQVAEDALI